MLHWNNINRNENYYNNSINCLPHLNASSSSNNANIYLNNNNTVDNNKKFDNKRKLQLDGDNENCAKITKLNTNHSYLDILTPFLDDNTKTASQIVDDLLDPKNFEPTINVPLPTQPIFKSKQNSTNSNVDEMLGRALENVKQKYESNTQSSNINYPVQSSKQNYAQSHLPNTSFCSYGNPALTGNGVTTMPLSQPQIEQKCLIQSDLTNNFNQQRYTNNNETASQNVSKQSKSNVKFQKRVRTPTSSTSATCSSFTSSGDQLSISPLSVGLNQQQLTKIEQKRVRNRIAAKKCRVRKLEKIAQLETDVKESSEKNTKIAGDIAVIQEEINQLISQLEEHKQHGCEVPDGFLQFQSYNC